jgi:hypothetical protein
MGGLDFMLVSWLVTVMLSKQLSTETRFQIGMLIRQLTTIPYPYVNT